MVTPDTNKCNEESIGVSRIVTCEVQLSQRRMCPLALKTVMREILSALEVNCILELDFNKKGDRGAALLS